MPIPLRRVKCAISKQIFSNGDRSISIEEAEFVMSGAIGFPTKMESKAYAESCGVDYDRAVEFLFIIKLLERCLSLKDI